MWILKNSKEPLENLKFHGCSKIDSIKTYHFYATIPEKKFKKYVFSDYRQLFFKQKWHPDVQICSDWESRYIFCETPL
jgi:hypothetical protein